MDKKPVYVKCPRCDLNYIDKKDKLCNICKAELSMPNSFYSDEGEDSLLDLCPLCKSNYISLEEDLCEKCRGKDQPLPVAPVEEDEDWRSFLDDESEAVGITTEDGTEILLSQIEEEELEKSFHEEADDFFKHEEEEEYVHQEPDDFEEDFELYDDGDDGEDDEEDEDEE